MKRKQVDNSWREKFKSNTTRVSFQLVLTRPMLEFLCATADDTHWDRSAFGGSLTVPDNWSTTEHALTRRGLIRRKTLEEIDAMRRTKKFAELVATSNCELTPAGRAVCDLLKVGGLFLEQKEALRRMDARKGRL